MWEVPEARVGEFLVNSSLDFGLIVYGVESNHALQEYVQLRMALGVMCDLEQRSEDIYRESSETERHGLSTDSSLMTMSS